MEGMFADIVKKLAKHLLLKQPQGHKDPLQHCQDVLCGSGCRTASSPAASSIEKAHNV